MNKGASVLFFSLMVLGAVDSSSQDLGVQAGLDFMKPMKVKGDTSKTKMRTGIRADFAYILPDYSFPVTSVTAIGYEYFFATTDSAKIELRDLMNGNYKDTTVLAKTSSYAITFNAGYEIPQDMDEFLLVNVNWAMGYLRNKTVFLVDNFDSSTEQIFYQNSGLKNNKTKSGYMIIDIGASVYYEFEKFRVFAKGMFRFGFGPDMDEGFGDSKKSIHLTAGVFIPLVKF